MFGLPGMGRHLVQGALNRDYTLVMGMVIVYAALMIALNLAGRPGLCLARSAHPAGAAAVSGADSGAMRTAALARNRMAMACLAILCCSVLVAASPALAARLSPG